ncbi:citrate synthase family protein [Polyangium aurulentum]|uniref:citrate synthase family protein n=1 Tax=Polyangium aurulentum TaxID=2567896 RepID=UPI0023DF38A7|nr:citrate synthase family protein [Polyangium aurulentum]
MDKVDQRGFSNQQAGSDNQRAELLTGDEAAALLGVKRETLYAYASRGLVRSVPAEGTRSRLYVRADLEGLRAKSDARRGHGPVAAAALHWGEPILATAISAIGPEGPLYRGRSAVALAEAATPFEAVAELLWTGELPAEHPPWGADDPGAPVSRLAEVVPEGAHPLTALALATGALAARDEARFGATDTAELARARSLLPRLAALLALPLDPHRVGQALAQPSVARIVLTALGARTSAKAEAAIERALVVMADHELNASTFAVRVVASTGADLYACVGAGLAALSGPRHGGECDRVEALVHEVARASLAPPVLSARARRGEAVPGFGHRLYTGGDPRTLVLLEAARALGSKRTELSALFAVVDAAREAGQQHPTVDVGLVAIALALGLPPGSAAGLFAIGRTAGWIAHALEQRAEGNLLRPRARYTGP